MVDALLHCLVLPTVVDDERLVAAAAAVPHGCEGRSNMAVRGGAWLGGEEQHGCEGRSNMAVRGATWLGGEEQHGCEGRSMAVRGGAHGCEGRSSMAVRGGAWL